LCCFSTSVYCRLFFISLSTQSGNFWIHRRTSVTRAGIKRVIPVTKQSVIVRSQNVVCCPRARGCRYRLITLVSQNFSEYNFGFFYTVGLCGNKWSIKGTCHRNLCTLRSCTEQAFVRANVLMLEHTSMQSEQLKLMCLKFLIEFTAEQH